MDALLRDTLVWDNHACLPLRPHDEAFLPQLERFRKSGVNVLSINIGFGEQGIEPHVRMLAHFRRWILARPDDYVLAASVRDLELAQRSGRLAIVFDVEGANAIDDQLSMVQFYYDAGVRWMLIAYNLNNRVGGGCMDEDCGLTEFGEHVIAEMNRVGMVVCCSHTGARTAMQAIEASRAPVVFSHSNPRALHDHPRNIADDLIRACAAKGGVVCVNGVGAFLGEDDTRSETVARNIDYLARLGGIDHVGIGLDFVFDQDELVAYLQSNPQLFGRDAQTLRSYACGFVAPEQIAEIAQCLQAMGYARTDIARVLGGNLLRVAREVWK
ncbi:MAG TPA: membrane dipeptidase [Candidatus Baltobacteraceae bacterium]|nr:membrane dipeptidase [Candidatus Baltobacteraceae bacterium]